MTHLVSLRGIALKILLYVVAFGASVCMPASNALAQHGGGHAGGGGHFGGGGGHMSSPHVSAPSSPHFSAPARIPAPAAAGAGTHSFVAVPPAVHLVTPPSANHPILGNHVTITPPQPIVTVPPHVVIGFPPPEAGGHFLAEPGFTAGSTNGTMVGTPMGAARVAGPLRFSGEGHEIWRDSPATAAPQAGLHHRFPVSPIFPPARKTRHRRRVSTPELDTWARMPPRTEETGEPESPSLQGWGRLQFEASSSAHWGTFFFAVY